MITQVLNFVLRGSDRYSPTLSKFWKDLDATGARAAKLGSSMQSLGLSMGAGGAIGAFATGLYELPGQMLRVDQALHQVQVVGEMTDAQMSRVAMRVRAIAKATNQSQEEILTGLNELIAKTGDPSWSLEILETVGRTATATGASIQELSNLAFTVLNNAEVPVSQLGKAFDVMTKAGKLGSFELKAMASEFPEIITAGRWLGGPGVQGVARFAAAMQIAKRSTPNDPEAVTGVRSFLMELRSPETISGFRSAGFDIVSFIREGMKDPSRDMLLELTKKIEEITHNDPFLTAKLFTNVRTQRFLMAMQQNVAAYKSMRDESSAATGVIARDFETMTSSVSEQIKKFKINITDFGFTAMLGPLKTFNFLMKEINGSTLAVRGTFVLLAGTIGASGLLIFGATLLKSYRELIPVLRMIIGLTEIQIAREAVLAALTAIRSLAAGSPTGAIAMAALTGLGAYYVLKRTGVVDAVTGGPERPAAPAMGKDFGWERSANPWEAGHYDNNRARRQLGEALRQESGAPDLGGYGSGRNGQPQKIEAVVDFRNVPRGAQVDTSASQGIQLTRKMGMTFEPSLYGGGR